MTSKMDPEDAAGLKNWCVFDGGADDQLESYHCVAPADASGCKYFSNYHLRGVSPMCDNMEDGRRCGSMKAQGEEFGAYAARTIKTNVVVADAITEMEKFIKEGILE